LDVSTPAVFFSATFLLNTSIFAVKAAEKPKRMHIAQVLEKVAKLEILDD